MPLAKADSRWLESKIEVKSHVEIGWLKLAAPLNIRVMSLTLDVSQVPTGWLKEVADINMADMLSTAEVSQEHTA